MGGEHGAMSDLQVRCKPCPTPSPPFPLHFVQNADNGGMALDDGVLGMGGAVS